MGWVKNFQTMATIYRQGDRGLMVKQIQRALKQAGFGVIDDGIWGPITTEAVKAFQKSRGLAADGLVGPGTLAKLGITATVQAVTPSPRRMEIRHGDIMLKQSKRKINWIVVHCTASPEGQVKTVEDIRRGHKKQGWSDIGYHYVVTLDGQSHLGRDVDVAGAHVSGHNSDSIGVVYVGGLENDPKKTYQQLKPKDTRTDKQKMELLSLLMDLRKLYPQAKIVGHRDFSPDKNHDGVISADEWIKACPSFDAKMAYRDI